jgi:hypothetical protein
MVSPQMTFVGAPLCPSDGEHAQMATWKAIATAALAARRKGLPLARTITPQGGP